MKIRTKGIIAIALITLMFFVALLMVAFFVIQPSYNNLENQKNNQGIIQTVNAIDYGITQLKGSALDYAEWDDTYNFVQNNNQAYIENNFVDATFENLNLVAIVNNSGNIVYCQSFNLIDSVKFETSNETRQILASDNALWSFPSLDSTVSGIVLFDSQPVLVVAAPILTSTNQGPIMGGLIFAKFIDNAEIDQLKEITNINFSIDAISSFELTNNRVAQSLMSNQQGVVMKENSPNVSTGYILINDVNSIPMFVLQVSQDRTVFQQGVWVEDIFLVAAISLTIALGVAMSILLEISVIKPMTKLASQIEAMPLNPKGSEPKSRFETDEIAIVANSAKDNLNKKFEAMSEVSRMVAHDLRNPLTGIKGATYILKKNYGSKLDEKGNAQLKTIENCVEYSDKIVRDLLEYSCAIKLDKIKINVKSLIDNSLSAFIIPDKIQVIHEVTDEFLLLVDSGQIQRVLSNLVKNSFDAMPDGGKLRIATRKVGGQVAIAFSDSGVGMSEDTLKKLWTPFFTTKAKGLGVGLSICKKIIEAHGGKIEVKSSLGKGTTFTVFLPLEKN